MGTGSFLEVESGRGVTLTPHPLLGPRSKNGVELVPLLSLRAFVAYVKGETYQIELWCVTVAQVRSVCCAQEEV
jgi:hypothetical protein